VDDELDVGLGAETGDGGGVVGGGVGLDDGDAEWLVTLEEADAGAGAEVGVGGDGAVAVGDEVTVGDGSAEGGGGLLGGGGQGSEGEEGEDEEVRGPGGEVRGAGSGGMEGRVNERPRRIEPRVRGYPDMCIGEREGGYEGAGG
jgi:hypothetical protein